MSIITKDLMEAIRRDFEAPTPESISSKSSERKGVMSRISSNVNDTLQSTAASALEGIKDLVSTTVGSRSDVDTSEEVDLEKESELNAMVNAIRRGADGINRSLTEEERALAYPSKDGLSNEESEFIGTDNDIVGAVNAPVEEESAPVTAETQGAGLMSPPVGDDAEVDTGTAEPVVEETDEAAPVANTTEDDTTFVSSFVDLMGTAEGTTDHTASEGQFTYAYGILPATASGYSLNADDYDTRRDFAEAVYAKMYEDAKSDYEDVFDGLTTDEAKGVLSLYINLGKLPTGVVNALGGETKDMDAAGDSLASVVHYTNKKTKVKYASKGLSVRRAGEYNTLRDGEEGFAPVTSVSVTGTKAAPVFNWLDASGNTVKSFASSKTLSPDSNMKSQAVD